MYKRRKTYALVLLSTAVLSQSLAYGVKAASTSTTPVKTTAAVNNLEQLGSIALKSSVSAKLTDINLSVQDSGNILTYTISYYNGSGSSVNLIDFLSKVTTTMGTVVQGTPISSSASIQSIAAKSTQSVTY